jgi:hypothetical protein
LDDAGRLDAVDAGALGSGEDVGFAEFSFLPAVAFVPVEAELGVGVEVVLGEEAVDELEGGAHAHQAAVDFEAGRTFGECGYAGTGDRREMSTGAK